MNKIVGWLVLIKFVHDINVGITKCFSFFGTALQILEPIYEKYCVILADIATNVQIFKPIRELLRDIVSNVEIVSTTIGLSCENFSEPVQLFRTHRGLIINRRWNTDLITTWLTY